MNTNDFIEYTPKMWKRAQLRIHFAMSISCFSIGFMYGMMLIFLLRILSDYIYIPLDFDFDSILHYVLLIIIALLLFTNIRFYLLYESDDTSMVIVDPKGKETTYEIIHMAAKDFIKAVGDRDYFDWGGRRGRGISSEIKSTFAPLWMNRVIYLRDPATHKIFAYCRKCKNLISIEELSNECPHCHSYVSYAGPQ